MARGAARPGDTFHFHMWQPVTSVAQSVPRVCFSFLIQEAYCPRVIFSSTAFSGLRLERGNTNDIGVICQWPCRPEPAQAHAMRPGTE
jgi:hypothetical protein